jgi:hypothetical protein
MSVTLIDRIFAIVIDNGVLRVDCISVGPNASSAFPFCAGQS